MTYFGFLIGFVLGPIVLLLILSLVDSQVRKWCSPDKRSLPLVYSFLIIAGIATLYTTPWDNYLVATRVWWYDPRLVLGITIGWVPLEEYLFFILQPILGGLLLIFLLSRKAFRVDGEPLRPNLRRSFVSIAVLVWIAAIFLMFAGRTATTYLGLELVWAIPAITLQLAYGADIIWRHRREVIVAVFALTIYLSLADAIAIQSGVWTINPMKSLGLLLVGILPVEEFVFFLLTNTMVGFGFVLVWSPESRTRLRGIWQKTKYGQQSPHLSKEL